MFMHNMTLVLNTYEDLNKINDSIHTLTFDSYFVQPIKNVKWPKSLTTLMNILINQLKMTSDQIH
ncbi:hypothetical protein crov540 [Cafeteria roenbergensis virus]|uniref:Uncharacterized protein n=1 Tax=Cafeteria roenbergensis virus (strain BV-PW1) TaxID=693272 RepID=E3T5W1_CROVB|nr:hypothetical protein crov540 [Cafeteria roenbergensis virus BV-PW1]ADO67574.1 hypothetical protein crov540 [Cafeteria roenbergensis virus BV-PW1]